MEISQRPGVIRFFLKHSIDFNGNCFPLWFEFLLLVYLVNASLRGKFGTPLEAWCRNSFEQSGAASFITIQRIFAKLVHAPYEMESKDLMVLVPRIYFSL